MASDIIEPAAPSASGKFPPGKSGNPGGRPRKSATSHTAAVRKAMDAKIDVTENGRRKRMTKSKIAATQLANKVAAGDLRAHKMLLDMERNAPDDQEEATDGRQHSAANLQIVLRLATRIRAFTPEES